jgi:peptide methionine sulfoxide reductase msrA/msrB
MITKYDHKSEVATFAGGCFWCMVQPFEEKEGVDQVISGYAGGKGENPTYHDYAQKGYVEAVQITYNPEKVTYEKLLNIFWRQIDPTDTGGQFGDRGPHYRSVIFYHTSEQKRLAEQSKKQLQQSGRFTKNIMTDLIPFSTFYPAEQYHQQYYQKNPEQYKSFKMRSGREQFLKDIWNEPKGDELRKKTDADSV